jgi:ADP-ribose pyrophosphatase YjhB (NUDIX family)
MIKVCHSYARARSEYLCAITGAVNVRFCRGSGKRRGQAVRCRTVGRVGMSAHIGRLRAAVGHDLLLLPSVSVLPANAAGQVLLVRHAGHDDGWAVLGGAVEVGESPAEAAVREAREEIGAEVRLLGLLDVLGGADYEVTYPNGDRAAYVTAVYEAEIISGTPTVADGELSEIAWFSPAELTHLKLSPLSRALLAAIGRI